MNCIRMMRQTVLINAEGPAVNESEFPRQWNLSMLLCSHEQGLTVAELAAELGVTERTVKRDLAVLRSVEIPVVETTGPHGKKWFRVEIDPSRIPHFNFQEAAALYLWGQQFRAPLAGTGIWSAALEAYRKLERILPQSSRDYLKKMSAAVHLTTVGASDYSLRADWTDLLMQAIEDQRVVMLEYHSLKSAAPRSVRIRPLGIVYHEGTMYLVAWAEEHDEIRHYKVDRVHGVELTVDRYTPPEGFDLKRHLASTLGVYGVDRDQPLRTVRVRFKGTASRYIREHRFHESQEVCEDAPDGSVVVSFQLVSLVELTSLVLGFGPRAEVIEPAEFRRELADSLLQTLNAYRM